MCLGSAPLEGSKLSQGKIEKDSACLGGGEQTPAAGRVAGRAKVMLMADRGATASAKVLHDASLSQASAGPQLETTAQTGTLPEETALGEPEDVLCILTTHRTCLQ